MMSIRKLKPVKRSNNSKVAQNSEFVSFICIR